MSKPITKKTRPPPTPKQPKPWDVRPLPKKGEWAPSKIHRSVGKALDYWSRVEIAIGLVFAAIVGKHDRREGVLRAFGSVLTFRGRVEMLIAAAEIYFLRYPDSPLKKRLNDFLEAALGFSARRNEIAHGIVGDFGWFTERQSQRYVLGPISFATNKRVIGTRKTGGRMLKPTYLYNAADMDYFAAQFLKLQEEADALFSALEKEDAEPLKPLPQTPDAPQG